MKKHFPVFSLLSLLFMVTGFSQAVWAQSEETEDGDVPLNMEEIEIISLPFSEEELADLMRDPEQLIDVPNDKRTPRRTVENFLASCDAGDFVSATTYLNFGFFSQDEQKSMAENYARQLYLLLRHLKVIDLSSISDDPRGNMLSRLIEMGEENLAPIEIIVETHEMKAAGLKLLDHEEESFLNLALVRSHEEGHRGEWLFSKYNVRDIPQWYQSLGYGFLGQYLPPFMLETEILTVALWQYLVLILLIVLGLVINYFLKKLVAKPFKDMEREHKIISAARLLKKMSSPMGFLLISGLYAIALSHMLLDASAYKVLISIVKGMAAFGIIWLLYSFSNIFEDYFSRMTQNTESSLDDQLSPVLTKVIKAIIIIIGAIFILQNFNVDVWGFIAGLGLGGIALALAAKDTVSNLFGSLTIFVDRPFQVGNYVKINNIEGTVEEVGLRTTKLRTADRMLITVPNSVLTTSSIINITAMDRRQISSKLHFDIQSDPQDIQWLIEEIRRVIGEHDNFWQGFFNVWLEEITEFSYKIHIVCYVDTIDFIEFTKAKESFLLDIVQRARERKVFLATHVTRFIQSGQD